MIFVFDKQLIRVIEKDNYNMIIEIYLHIFH